MRGLATFAGLALVLASACTEDREPAPSAGSTSTTGAGESSGSSSSSGAADESTGPGWPLPTDDDLLTCVRSCEFPSDCCPPDSTGLCPGGFPFNYMCIEGLCVAPPCMADDECTGAGEVCRPVRGLPSCVLPCDGDDAPCMAADPDLTCMGMTDDGDAYCFAHCSTPGGSCGIQLQCDEASGECVCAGEGQCQTNWLCV